MELNDVRTIVANLDDFIELPNGIERLRKAVLTLAVSGRIVPQDAKEGAAEELYAEILKSSREKNKEIPLNVVPFSIPKSWKFVRLSEIYEVNPRNNVSDNTVVSFIPMTKIHSAWSQRPDTDENREWKTVKKGYTHIKEGDVLLAKITPCFENGKSGIAQGLANGIGAGTTELHIFRDATRKLVPEYLLALLHSTYFVDEATKNMTGTAGQKRIPTKFVEDFVFPLPPVGEQKRIVKRVDELMQQFDKLEARKNECDEVRARLTRNAMRALGSDDSELPLKHLTELIKTCEDVAALNQVVLTLAVSGKLVAQDPKDGTASELLKEHEQEVGELGKKRKIKELIPINPDEVPFGIPRSWIWARFGNITINRDGERIPLSREVRKTRKGKYDYYGASGIIDHIDDYLFEKPLLLIGEDGANLINRSTPIAFIARGKYWVNNHAHIVDVQNGVDLEYLTLFINSTDLRQYLTGTAQPKMNQAKMKAIPVAVPPLAEQKRIVMKVQEIREDIQRLQGILS